jgi:hypothetical protein
MLDFEKLVEQLLLCEASGPIITVTGVFPVKDVCQEIHSKYSTIPPNAPTDDSFYNTVQNNIFTRGSAYPLSEEDMIPYYPYIDYLCYINQLARSGTTNIKLATDNWSELKDTATSSKDITVMSGDWLYYFKNTGSKPAQNKPNPHPIIDYLPTSEDLRGLRAKLIEILLSKGVLGKMAIENYIKNNYNLAEAVNSAVSLGQQEISIINRKQEDKKLNEILLNPLLYTTGGAASPKPIAEKYRTFQESIFAIAKSLPGYAGATSLTPETLLYSPVSRIQQHASSITEAKMIIKQLEAMSNRLPGQKQIMKKATSAFNRGAEAAQGALLGVKIPGM